MVTAVLVTSIGVYIWISVMCSFRVAQERGDSSFIYAVCDVLASLMWLPIYLFLVGLSVWRRMSR